VSAPRSNSQIVKREFHDGTSEAFVYNPRGALIEASNATGRFVLDRDPVGRILRESQNVAGETHWVESTYDAVKACTRVAPRR
jgi:YD repeat-containing protein